MIRCASWTFFACLWVLASAGCTNMCEQAGRHRQAYLDRQHEGGAPHLQAALPFELVNAAIEPAVRAMASREIRLGGAGLLGGMLAPGTARVTEVSVGPGPEGHLGLDVDLDVRWGAARLATLHVGARLRPVLDRPAGRLVATLGADDLETAAVRLEQGSAEELAAALRAGLPPLARSLVDSGAVEALGSSMASALLQETWPLLRGWVAGALGSVAHIEVDLPPLPIERVELTSEPDDPAAGLVVSFWTALPVDVIGPASLRPVPPAGGSAVTLVIPGPTLAEIGNWAMADGRLPSRFDGEGRPDAEGVLQAALEWRGGERPLAVHLWRTESPCGHALLGATPVVRLVGDQVAVEVSDGRLESLSGEGTFRLGAWLRGLWSRTFEASRSVARGTTLTVAGRPYDATLSEIRREGDHYGATITLLPTAAPPAGPRP